MEIIKTVTGGICTLRIIGGIDRFARASLREALSDAGTQGEVHLDLADVELAGSVLINLLIEIRNQNPGESRKIKIVNAPEHALAILRAFRIHEFYRVNQRERT